MFHLHLLNTLEWYVRQKHKSLYFLVVNSQYTMAEDAYMISCIYETGKLGSKYYIDSL